MAYKVIYTVRWYDENDEDNYEDLDDCVFDTEEEALEQIKIFTEDIDEEE